MGLWFHLRSVFNGVVQRLGVEAVAGIKGGGLFDLHLNFKLWHVPSDQAQQHM